MHNEVETCAEILPKIWTETFRTYHFSQFHMVLKTTIIVGSSNDIARCTGASHFSKINFEDFNATEVQKQSTDDSNDCIFPGLLTAKCLKGAATFSAFITYFLTNLPVGQPAVLFFWLPAF